ncbi:MAG: ferritin-like domain-containing protein [Azospirillaceae bacterium]|nr:ferritin-like domain-containing protein [Azospirillaceae bacterium]
MDGDRTDTVGAAAVAVLSTAAPARKVALTAIAAAAWQAGTLAADGAVSPPDRPARPERPVLLAPREMPKRRKAGGPASRVAMIHALAHIELNAIDLAWDIVARFGAAMPRAFTTDWIGVAADEARHFDLLSRHLAALGADYGALPAHDGLWQAAQETAHDVLARLAVVPMILEARGLDVTPAIIAALEQAGDREGAAALRLIGEEEVGHVAIGCRWFEQVCDHRGLDPAPTWQVLVQRHFRGHLRRPFNLTARLRAGFLPHYYEPIASD